MTSDPAGLYTAALTLTNERRYREAEAALDAAASGADDNLRARIAGTRAFVLDQLGRPDEGEALCRRVLAGDALTAHTRGVIGRSSAVSSCTAAASMRGWSGSAARSTPSPTTRWRSPTSG
ncbi:hypothetical protein [Microbacterium aurum]